MPRPANLVNEVSLSTGTGPFTLAQSGGQRFSTAYGTGSSNLFDVFGINETVAGEWFRGLGYMSDANTLVITTVYEGSNGTSPVNFSAGTKRFANDMPAAFQYQAYVASRVAAHAQSGGI